MRAAFMEESVGAAFINLGIPNGTPGLGLHVVPKLRLGSQSVLPDSSNGTPHPIRNEQTLRKYLFVTPNKRGRLVLEGAGSGDVMAWNSVLQVRASMWNMTDKFIAAEVLPGEGAKTSKGSANSSTSQRVTMASQRTGPEPPQGQVGEGWRAQEPDL
ncbi:MAG: hypothetical protein FRX49_06296 [Trebouxia sp. A1-2]|nr:MAG: hypothetical protein FRX49_06296 [Trebouxia sp. A1-2]